MPAEKPPAPLNIPSSKHTVSVSIINTTGYMKDFPVSMFMGPEIPGHTSINAPSYSFLIKHDNPEAKSKYDTLIFDLGIRKDLENSPKAILERFPAGAPYSVEIEKNVYDILKEYGDDPAHVGGIIWSHYHLDNMGDLSTFPPSTDLIVGPGFRAKVGDGYPKVEDCHVDGRAWEGRHLREINFETEGNGLKLGRCNAIDFFGDGSFYLLDMGGSTVGHLCALARTSLDPREFLVMGGDIAIHPGEFRPSEYRHLPENIQPNPLVAPFAEASSVCPGAMFQALHPKKSSTEPFMQPTDWMHGDIERNVESLRKWEEFDAYDNVWCVIAHDASLLDVVEFYPKSANDWKKKEWQEQSRWRFLRDFDTGSISGV